LRRSIKASMSGLMLLLLLSGCATKLIASNEADATVQPSDKVQSQAEIEQSDVQSDKERQLVLLFQALLQMDRKEGLSLSKEQAGNLLPIIQKSRDQGEITAAEQKQALDLLSADQNAFYNDLASKMKDRMNRGNRKNLDNLTPEEREKLIEQFKSRNKDNPHADPGNKNNPGGGDLPPAGKGLGRSMEQQLIDLLEAKINK
jgi:hypothetical protein